MNRTARLARIAHRHRHTAAGREIARVVANEWDGHWCFMWMAGPYHVTHKYLGREGEIDRRDIQDCIDLVHEYFRVRKPVAGLWEFSRPDMFGPDEDTYVLRRDPTEDMMLDLKDDLDLIVPDKWDDYRPHVTCDPVFKSLTIRPDRYALVCGGVDVRSWRC